MRRLKWPSPSRAGRRRWANDSRVNRRQVTALITSVSDLITFACEVHARQIPGGPAWLESESDAAELLADRSMLTFDRETKEPSVHSIVVAKPDRGSLRTRTIRTVFPSVFRGLGVLPGRDATWRTSPACYSPTPSIGHGGPDRTCSPKSSSSWDRSSIPLGAC
jgi:hypothetical protein